MVDVRADNGQPPGEQGSESGDSYPVGSPIPLSAQREPACFTPERDESLDAPPRPNARYQFSLAEMFLVISLAAVILSVLGYLPGGYSPENFAGVAGFGVLAALVVLAYLKPKRFIVHMVWWALLVFYLGACIAALLVAS